MLDFGKPVTVLPKLLHLRARSGFFTLYQITPD
jgi:hypothetical protein